MKQQSHITQDAIYLLKYEKQKCLITNHMLTSVMFLSLRNESENLDKVSRCWAGKFFSRLL